MGRIVAWDESSLGTNCRLGRIVAWDELSLYVHFLLRRSIVSGSKLLTDAFSNSLVNFSAYMISIVYPFALVFPETKRLIGKSSVYRKTKPGGNRQTSLVLVNRIVSDEWTASFQLIIIRTFCTESSFATIAHCPSGLLKSFKMRKRSIAFHQKLKPRF